MLVYNKIPKATDHMPLYVTLNGTTVSEWTQRLDKGHTPPQTNKPPLKNSDNSTSGDIGYDFSVP